MSINYGFNSLQLELITADVNKVNENLVTILDKLFTRFLSFTVKKTNAPTDAIPLKKKIGI